MASHRGSKLFLGVDGGGTNCRVRLTDESLVTLGEVTNGRSNLQLDNGDPAYQSIMDGTREVFAQAGIDYAETARTYACFGMAGGRLPSARESFAARQWPFAGVEVFDDIDIARAGAHGGEDGAVAIIGTGSAGLALVNGQRHQVGGWGFYIGDQMSGAIMGRELVRRSVEAFDGFFPRTPLGDAVVETLGGSINAVMDWSFQGRKPADYGALMPLFVSHFEKGDPLAIVLMDIQLGYIDAYVNWFKQRGAEKMAIVGGFGQRLMPLLTKRYGDFVTLPRHEPLHGAVLLAHQIFAAA